MRLAIFGGTFDPIHQAHLTIAREAAHQFALDRLLMIPAAHPPHKATRTYTSYEHRYRMVELACDADPLLVPSRLEAGAGKSYSIDTITNVKEALRPGDVLFFLIGADAFAEIRTWHRWLEVIREVTFIVVHRPGHRYEVPTDARALSLETVDLPVSSSEIRARLARGEAPPEVPPAVLAYIRDHHLY